MPGRPPSRHEQSLPFKPSKVFLDEVAGSNPAEAEKLASMPVDKPNVSDVFAAFQEFQTDSRRAGVNMKHHQAAQAKLRDKLTQMNLARHIDWSDCD